MGFHMLGTGLLLLLYDFNIIQRLLKGISGFLVGHFRIKVLNHSYEKWI